MAAKRRKIQRYQPDPLLREGPRSTSWGWLMGMITVAAIALTMFALSGGDQNIAQRQGPNSAPNQPAATTGAGISSQPTTPPSPGRGNAAAPTETQGTTQR